jgi:hypothetical protein
VKRRRIKRSVVARHPQFFSYALGWVLTSFIATLHLAAASLSRACLPAKDQTSIELGLNLVDARRE